MEETLFSMSEFPATVDWGWDLPSPLPARVYQQSHCEAIWREFRSVRATLLHASVGVGKTVTVSHLARAFPPELGRVLFLVNRDELVQQFVAALQKICPHDVIEVEQGSRRAMRNSQCGFCKLPGRIVVASKDSLWKEDRLHKFDPDEFGLIVIDEAHLAKPKNTTWWNILAYFKKAKLLFITATPDLKDERGHGRMYETVAASYTMPQAVADGWLVPVYQRYCRLAGFDYSGVRMVVNKEGERDLARKPLSQILMEESVIQGMVDQCTSYSTHQNKYGNERQVIVFCASVDHAEEFCRILNRWDAKLGTGKAECLSDRIGSVKKRRHILEGYREKRVRYLTNYHLLGIGVDLPETRIIFNATVTTLADVYEQRIGRGMRPSETIVPALHAAKSAEERRALILASCKPSVLVVDPLGDCGRHKVKNLVHALGGEYTNPEVERAAKIMQKPPNEPLSLEERIAQYDSREALRLAREQLIAEEEERRKEVIIRGKWTERGVDLFNPYDVLRSKARAEPVSKRTRVFLRKQRYTEKQIDQMSQKQAGCLVGEWKRRWKLKLCSPRQADWLEKKGYSRDLPKEEAVRIMDAWKQNNWKRPEGF